MALARWLPYLDDEVVVYTEVGPARGTVSRWDPAVAVLDIASAPSELEPGQRVRARWRVGDDEHESTATVEEVTASAWTVRLDGPVPLPDFSRRRQPRALLNLPVTFTHPFSGSLGTGPQPARALDVSVTGMRLAIDAGAVDIGDVVEVQMQFEGRVERLIAYVVWESRWPTGDRAAGLRFRDEVRLETTVS